MFNPHPPCVKPVTFTCIRCDEIRENNKSFYLCFTLHLHLLYRYHVNGQDRRTGTN